MIEISSDGTGPGTTISSDGQDIAHLVSHVAWHVGRDMKAGATLTLDQQPLTATTENVDYCGLEDVPTEALEQELARRSSRISYDATITEHGAWLTSMGYSLPSRRWVDAIHDAVAMVRIYTVADAVSITVNHSAREKVMEELGLERLPARLWGHGISLRPGQREDVVVRKLYGRDEGDVS